MLKKIIVSIALAVSLIVAAGVDASAGDTPIVSDWAREEVARAEAEGLIPYDLAGDCRQSINRRQTAVLMVNFAEVMSGKEITDYKSGTFSDMAGFVNSVEVEKAYAAGITTGAEGGTLFLPSKSITREEFAVMLCRTFRYIERAKAMRILPEPVSALHFSDQYMISSWALDEMKIMLGAKILRGISDTTINPHGAVSIEQAVVLIYRGSCFINSRLNGLVPNSMSTAHGFETDSARG